VGGRKSGKRPDSCVALSGSVDGVGVLAAMGMTSRAGSALASQAGRRKMTWSKSIWEVEAPKRPARQPGLTSIPTFSML
jgi:hypothetical protein